MEGKNQNSTKFLKTNEKVTNSLHNKIIITCNANGISKKLTEIITLNKDARKREHEVIESK